MGNRSFEAFNLPGQRGAATRPQLVAHGWTYAAISHALQTQWQEPAPGVFLAHRGAYNREQQLVIGALWAGEWAVLTAGAALNIYGAHLTSPGVPRFVVPWTQRAALCGAARRVRSRHTPVVAHRRGPLAVVSPARALIDVAREESPTSDELEAITITCLQQRVTTPELLIVALERGGQGHLAGLRRGLDEFMRGAWSVPEATLRHLMLAGDFPPFVMNHELVDVAGQPIGTPDAYFLEAGVAVQVHSRAHHQGFDSEGIDLWSQTVQRDNRYAAAGIAVVAVTPTTLAREAPSFLRQLTEALRIREGMATPHLVVECTRACNKIHALAPIASHARR